ncbi:ATP-binding cassette domain-containing protein [Mobiluncus mulieris]|nr:ATP-binding cassette domain-containing protein [Mobiluncus mulieris]
MFHKSWLKAFVPHRLALYGLVVMMVYAVVLPFFAAADSHEANLAQARLAPSASHWFGTDAAGHDLLVRVALGLRVSLIVAAACAVISTVIGVLIGAVAAAWGGKTDSLLMRFTDTINALPQLLLGIAIVAFYPGSLVAIIASIALVHWSPVARIVRSIALSTRELEYVEAAYLAGASHWQVARRHLLPSVFGQMKVSVVLLFPHAIWHESTLSFLGLGISPDKPSLGTLLEVARTEILIGCWWELVFPAGALVLLSLLIFGWASGLGKPARGKSERPTQTAQLPGDLSATVTEPPFHEVPAGDSDEITAPPALEFRDLNVIIPSSGRNCDQQTHETPAETGTDETEPGATPDTRCDLVLENHVNLQVSPGELHVLLGQSGAGKSILAKAATGMLPGRMQVSGEISVAGVRLYGKNCSWQQVRGRLIAVAAQSSATAFAPNHTIGNQLEEAVKILRRRDVTGALHEVPTAEPGSMVASGSSLRGEPTLSQPGQGSLTDAASASKSASNTVAELCEMTGFPPDSLSAYPHELSGGMLTRANLALALAGNPTVLIADEVTAGLDEARRNQIWQLLRVLADRGIAVLTITHDLAMLLDLPLADQITVLGAGRVLEQGSATQVLGSPRHVYTQELLAALPRNLARVGVAVSGKTPDSGSRDESELAPREPDTNRETVLEVNDLAAGYHGVPVVSGFNLCLHRGETVGWFGDSGCGKTTTARAIAGRLAPLAGQIRWGTRTENAVSAAAGENLVPGKRTHTAARPEAARHPGVAMLFQSPRRSVNPRWTLRQIIEEPLLYAGIPQDVRHRRCAEICGELGIPPGFMRRFPAEVSEGQLQRIALARCLLTEPTVLICDEATAMLDAFSTASLVRAIQRRSARGLAVIAISHDRELLDYWADRSLNLG